MAARVAALNLRISIPPSMEVEKSPREQAPAPPPPEPLALWHKKVFQHLFSWRYNYTGYETSSYEKRKGLWNYEEVMIDSSEQVKALKSTATAAERELIQKELERLDPIFESLEEALEKAMDNLSNFADEIEELSEKANPKERSQRSLIALTHAEIVYGQFTDLYKDLLDQWEIVHRCSVNLTKHWPLPFESLARGKADNFFGGPPFDLAAHRPAVENLYSTYKNVLYLHNLYISRFISTVVATRDYLRSAVPLLKRQIPK